MGTFPQSKICHTSNKSDIYLRIWADFFWNFGLSEENIGATVTLEVEVAAFLRTRKNATSPHNPPLTKTPLVADSPTIVMFR
jgi:hypothetical protein